MSLAVSLMTVVKIVVKASASSSVIKSGANFPPVVAQKDSKLFWVSQSFKVELDPAVHYHQIVFLICWRQIGNWFGPVYSKSGCDRLHQVRSRCRVGKLCSPRVLTSTRLL